MNKLLSIVIPVFGKEPKMIMSNLDKLTHECNDLLQKNIEIIIIYKNSNELNYDGLMSLGSRNSVIVKKVDNDFKRTKKILEAINNSNGKYILELDAHHSIDSNGLKYFLKEIEEWDEDIIFMVPKEKDIVTGKITKKVVEAVTAGRYMVKSKVVNNISKEIDFDVIYHDDWVLGLFALSKLKTVKYRWSENSFYIKNYGAGLSNTFQQQSTDSLIKMVIDFSTILNFFVRNQKNYENELYRAQLTDAFENVLRNHLRSKGFKMNDVFEGEVNNEIYTELLELIMKNVNFNGLYLSLYEILDLERSPTLNKFISDLHINEKWDEIPVNIVYSFDNLEQYEMFKISVKSHITKNLNLYLLIPENYANKNVLEDIETFLKTINLSSYKINILKGNNIIEKNAKFNWLLAPFLIDDENIKYPTIISDNDTIFNVELITIWNSRDKKPEKIIYGVAGNSPTNFSSKTNMLNFFSTKEYLEINNSNYTNFGVLLVENIKWIKRFNKKDNVIKIFENKLDIFKKNNYFLSDQDLIWTSDANLIGEIPGKYNIRLHNFRKSILTKDDDWVLHYNLWNDKKIIKFDFINFFALYKQELQQGLDDIYKSKSIMSITSFVEEKYIDDFGREISELEKNSLINKLVLILQKI